MTNDNSYEEILDNLKSKDYRGKILITSDIHKEREGLERIMKKAADNDAELSIDLGDLEIQEDGQPFSKYQEDYNKIATDNGLKAGFPLWKIAEISASKQEEISASKKEDITPYLCGDRIFVTHYMGYNDSSQRDKQKVNYIYVGSPFFNIDDYFNYDLKRFKQFLDKREKCPILLLKGHDHQSFVTKRITYGQEIREINPSAMVETRDDTYGKRHNNIWDDCDQSQFEEYLRTSDEMLIERGEDEEYITNRKLEMEKLKKNVNVNMNISLKEPGLYIINPGKARCTLLDIKDGEYVLSQIY